MKMRSFAAVAVLAACLLTDSVASANPPQAASNPPQRQLGAEPSAKQDWPASGGGPGNAHYSPLVQINRANVTQLEVAWSFDTQEPGGLQTSPIIVEGTLYGITPTQKVFALNAATGALLWKFDSGITGTQPDRGLAFWSNETDKRILVGVMHFVYALDAATGKPIPTFGKDGRIDLRENLSRDDPGPFVSLTSPAVVYKDLFIVGGRNAETLPAPPGDIRAFDARTGKLRWTFHTVPQPGEFGYETWPKDAWKYTGAANHWAGMAVDAERGIVYVPTASAAFDFYGANRVGDDLFANCLIALDAETGKRLWHFQGVHHDIWDRDFPSAPVLLTVQRDAKKIEAVAQTTKQGFVYVFDRATGAPLFPINSRKYPPSTVPGEVPAAEQPLPAKPAPYARQLLTDDLLTKRTPEVHQWAVERFRTFRSEGQFVPFSVGTDTVIFPGFDGGAEWGGPAVDPDTAILYVNSNEMAWIGSLAKNTGENSPKATYLSQCAICHGERLAGSPPAFPALVDVGARLSPGQLGATIKSGKGRMPGFPNLSADQLQGLVDFLTGAESKEVTSSQPRAPGLFSRFTRPLP